MKKISLMMSSLALILAGCHCKSKESAEMKTDKFQYVVDRFADIEIMAYQVDNWDSLTLKQKELVYYLSEAALCGREILYDQNCKANLPIKNLLETMVKTYSGNTQSEEWQKLMVYIKRFWFSNGIHHHYSNEKFFPELSQKQFVNLISNCDTTQKRSHFSVMEIVNMIYNPDLYPKRVSTDAGKDLVLNSSVNFYQDVTQQEVEGFYEDFQQPSQNRPLSEGLNSKLVKKDGKIVEEIYRSGGLYGEAIDHIIYWLEKAKMVAENKVQQEHISKLIAYYKTGNLKTWDEYNVLWVQDNQSRVDYVNGFIEVYTDPLGRKATWESVVNYKDLENTKRSEIIAANAQWFEDHSPIAPEYKKDKVKGVTAKVITVAQLGGDCYPATPIGINLPNANWIRKEYGSKSVTMGNIMYAYDQARMGNGTIEEFYLPEEVENVKKYGYKNENLFVDMHECLGHGSGQMLPGVNDGMLKNYHSVIEETRADLFALYYLADPKMVELGLVDNENSYQSAYYKNILNGYMLQLNRIKFSENIEQAHMRNRAIISNWLVEKGQQNHAIEVCQQQGKTYLKINDYHKIRTLIGELLAKVQDIKSKGDYQAAKNLVEIYGIKINSKLHQEVIDRFKKLNIAPYGGFVNPEFVVKKDGDIITDIMIHYSKDYVKQMMTYSQKYAYLKF